MRASQGGGAKADRASFERRQRSEVRAGGASYAAHFGCGALGQSIAAGLVGAVFARWFLLDEHTSYLAGFGLAVLLATLAIPVTRRCFTRRCVSDDC